MIISERLNSRRGISRFSPRSGCSSGPLANVRRVLSNAVWDQDITDTTNGLDVERKLGIVLDLTAQSRHLHIDRAFERDVEAGAERRARKRPAGIGGEQLQQLGFGAGQLDASCLRG